ncbi:hypothetical protein V6N13_105621 [Hibiscus sabdariffa]|uniref:Pentatricopeptide repeat-containing protein n=1 Tax=Hibiscus sabdariffa TaxID=183260 RepID=A0ABR2EY90_9ROSI
MVPRRYLLNSSRFLSTLKAADSSKADDLYTMNKQLSHLIRSGRFHEAKSLFDGMGKRNTVTWNSMISGYVRRREITQARKLFDEMPDRDTVSWNLMISGYASYLGCRFLEEGKKLFEQMPMRDVVSWNTMISGYAKNGRMDEAKGLFESMPEKNVVSWNAMITGFFDNGDTSSATEYFKRMPERDSASVNAFVSGLVRNGELDEAVRALIECGNRDGWSEDLIASCNTLIAAYGQKGRVDDARRLFNQIPSNGVQRKRGDRVFERNVVTWNSMIMCYVKAGDIFSARELFDQMVDKDTISWNTMINGYVQLLDMEEALNLFNAMPKPDNMSWNSMISGYAQNGNLERAREYFEMMPQKYLVSWNTMIAGYEKNKDYKGAIKLFIRMQAEGEKHDRHTLSSILSASTGLVNLQLGMQIHQLVSKSVIPDVPIKNSLITVYSKCGALMESRIIFDELKSPKEVISWNAIIGGYASHGYALEALEFFESMKKNNVQPTYITFISVLSACTHAGLVDEGWAYFKSMVSEYGIEPRIEHYASLVDNVARHGQLEKAMDLIKSMPFEPDKEIWGAVLSACRLHNNVELAQVAAEALMRLEPESSAAYILLYNMYAEAGQWDAAAEVREMMERNNIRKQTAFSLIDSSHS